MGDKKAKVSASDFLMGSTASYPTVFTFPEGGYVTPSTYGGGITYGGYDTTAPITTTPPPAPINPQPDHLHDLKRIADALEKIVERFC